MKGLSQLYILLIFYACVAPLRAQTVKWIIAPQYDQIEFYCDGVYLYHQGSQVGLMDDTGKRISDSECDSITPYFQNGFSLLLESIGNQEATLVGIYNCKTRKVTRVQDHFIVKKDYAFFNDDRLPVKDDDGNWGYIGIDGKQAIPCKYLEAWPFSLKRALVRLKKKNVVYIKVDGTMISLDINRGVIGDGTPIFLDGTADVSWNKGAKFARLDFKGNIAEINKEEFRKIDDWLTEFREHLDKATASILSPTIQAFPENIKSQLQQITVIDEQAVGVMNGKVGLLQLVHGNFDLGEPKITMIGKDKNKQSMVKLQMNIPDGLSCNDLTFEIDKGDGQLREVDANDYQVSSDLKTVTFGFIPDIKTNSKNVVLRIVAKNHDLILFNQNDIHVKMLEPNPDKRCRICGKAINDCKYKGLHPKCGKCGLIIDESNHFKDRCEGNGNHRKCPLPSCGKYIYNKGNRKNRCPVGGVHRRPE